MLFFQHQNVFCKKYATGFQVSFFPGIAERATHAWVRGKRIDYHPQGNKRRGGRGDVPCVRTCFLKRCPRYLLTRKLLVTDEGRPTARQLQANVSFFNNDLMTACSRPPLSLPPIPLFIFFFFFFFLLPARLFRAILHYLSLLCRLAPLRNCNTPGFILMIQYKDFPLRNKIVSVLWNNLPHRGHFKLALPEFDATVTERVHCRPVIRYNYFFLIEDRGREKNSTVL